MTELTHLSELDGPDQNDSIDQVVWTDTVYYIIWELRHMVLFYHIGVMISCASYDIMITFYWMGVTVSYGSYRYHRPILLDGSSDIIYKLWYHDPIIKWELRYHVIPKTTNCWK